jgi:thioredoxin-related protein
LNSRIQHDPSASLVGKQIPIAKADWQSSTATIAIFLSSSCHFCEASVPFYARLLLASREAHDRAIPVIAISAEPREDLKRHFAAEQLEFSEVYQIPFPNNLLRATPTLMVIDKRGTIQRAVVGQLPVSRQTEFLEFVRTGNLGANLR